MFVTVATDQIYGETLRLSRARQRTIAFVLGQVYSVTAIKGLCGQSVPMIQELLSKSCAFRRDHPQ